MMYCTLHNINYLEGQSCPGCKGMARKTVVSDNFNIVNIQGLRYVKWGETSYAGVGTKPWYVSIYYKGSHDTFYYKTENEARALFSKIRDVMDI